MTKPLDVITIGRSSVDLYGVQIGGRLEDMASFRKYIGGSPTNIAAGTARLGLKSALITRVGDEHMGRFIREELAKEGVDVARRENRSGAPDRAGSARHSRREAVPADLLPRRLRRHGALRRRHRRGFHLGGAFGRGDGDASQPPADRGGGAEGAADRPPSTARAPRSTSTTALISGAWRAMARAKAASSKALRSRRSCRATSNCST